MKKEIGVIGYGRFGTLAVRYLKKYFHVYVGDVKIIRKKERRVHNVTIRVAARKDIVILAVPINRLQSVLHTIVPYLKHGAIVCDVCSVKEYPVRWMKDILPDTVSILGTHPLFGPDSASEGIEGKSIIITPVRITPVQLRKVTHSLSDAGLRAMTMSASRHDRLMAQTLFLTQFIGRGLSNFQLPHTSVATQNFELLNQIVSSTENDSPELFRDMFRYNRFARSIPKRILRNFSSLSQSLSLSDH